LVATEEGEIATLQTYLPQPLSDAEIDALIAGAISAAGVSGSAGMGKGDGNPQASAGRAGGSCCRVGKR
jgi:uncharacterized protein YqeY